ncbi:translation initiation factor IF-2 N-terminal domain-containing protein [Gordonia sp. 'Campus']|uniref:translation initiation factor IF-2 N-terminal domain-containing protein n=1 Tax=Gordonia sp. 'Campus' TaxID=2915824 RepID=UPI001EE40A7D|nr:translation initiation factor IF-2 N-terminal domain-containing protein [Gordonia sp. 'Campus']
MTDNGSPADANAASEPAEEFPTKLRVHALARFLGLTSRQVLAHLASLGVQTRSPQSSVDRDLAKAVAERVRAESAESAETADAAGSSQTVSPEPEAREPEVREPEVREPEVREPEVREPEVQESEVQAPEPQAPASTAAESEAETKALETQASEAPASEVTGAGTSTGGAGPDEGMPTLFSAASSQFDAPVVAAASEGDAGVGTQPLFLQPQAPAEKPKSARPSRAKAKSDTANSDTGTRSQDGAETADGSETRESRADEPATAKAEDSPAGNEAVTEDSRSDVSAPDDSRSDDSGSDDSDSDDSGSDDSGQDDSGQGRARRRRRGRRGRGRGRGDQGDSDDTDSQDPDGQDAESRDSASRASDSQKSDDADTDGGVDTDDTDKSPSDNSSSAEKSGPKSSSDDAAGDDESQTDAADDAESEDGRPSGKRTRRRSRRSSTDKNDPDKSEPDKSDSDKSDSDKGESSKGEQPSEGADDADSRDGSDDSTDDDDSSSTRRRRRRRRRKGGGDSDEASADDPPNTVVHEREPRSKRARDEVQGISGSTRLEAKRQRRRDGRDAGRRRPPILTESEFLARREAVDRVMVVRERSANTQISDGDGHEHTAVEDYTQVAVLEDGVLVEHFVTTATSSSMVGNIYLGRVQNVLPGMEAAFVDIGRGRNGVLYAGEVNWDAAGLDGGSRKIEQALKPGDNVLVQVSKDPVGHKGARLTTQISLAGRYLVYVPGGSSTGISRKLPDVERKRLKQILAKLVPDEAGVIIRTASEGVSAEELGADIARLESQWKAIDESVTQAKKGGASAPKPLYEEPDLLVRVVRDLFNEDFKKLVVEGEKAWNLVEGYVGSVASDLMERVEKFEKPHADAPDSFVVHRIDEQLAKALDRKVWLPSGGTLIIEHTEAMTVVDVNTGKFTGSGGNLEETVTRNNLEAAEEIVRQMRLRDIGGMIIVDFIDMVLESNRDLVLRRLTEALARDRTRHQVSEVTSLGLVQMTRKRLGTGLLEAFSTTCTSCNGRGIIVHANPVEVKTDDSARSDGAGSKRSRRGKKKAEPQPDAKPAVAAAPAHKPAEHPMFRAMAAHTHDDEHEDAHGHVDAPRTESVESEPTPAESSTESAAPEAVTSAAAPTEVVEAGVVHAEVAPAGPTQDEPVSAAATVSADGSGQADGQAPAPARRRRRVVRRPAQTTTAPENVVMTAVDVVPETPLTTFGPMSSEPAEAVVAVRRRPRKRSAGRPAGPPPADA